MSHPPFKKSKGSIPFSNLSKDEMVSIHKVESKTASELPNRNDKRQRYVKFDKSKKAVKKKSRKFDKNCSQYDSIIRDNVIKDFFSSKNPTRYFV